MLLRYPTLALTSVASHTRPPSSTTPSRLDMIGADGRCGWFSRAGGQSEVNGKLLWRLKEHADLAEPYELEELRGREAENDRSAASRRKCVSNPTMMRMLPPMVRAIAAGCEVCS